MAAIFIVGLPPDDRFVFSIAPCDGLDDPGRLTTINL
jgi:hypothetical protein